MIEASCADSGTSNVKFHVVYWEERTLYPACGTGNDGTTMMSSATLPAHAIKISSRCKRPACQLRFAAADAEAAAAKSKP